MTIVLPNIRKLFIPDPGYIMYDADLKGADAQVVAWEADDEDLKAAFRAGLDIHIKNATDMWGEKFTQLKGRARDKERQKLKQAVHGTNYGGSSRTLTTILGGTVREWDDFQRRWFTLHPGIKTNFHQKVDASLNTNKTVSNAYGFRRIYFDRPTNCFAEALAWIPQSTVAITTYLGARELEKAFPSVEFLLQTHDSITFQFKIGACPGDEEIKAALVVHTPYPDPLYIPWDLKKSDKSWGDCK